MCAYRQTAELLERLRSLLEQGKHVTIHCRQGIVRASVTACLLVMLGHDAEHVFEWIAAAWGRPVPDSGEQHAWVAAFAARRIASEAEALGDTN